MICSTCRPKVVTCPQCRGRYNAGNRLYFAERMLEKVPVLCRFSDDGCDVEMVPGKIAKHEAVCEYREVECDHNNWGCRVTCSRREMELHVSTCHYKPVLCPVTDCKMSVPQKFLMRHLSMQHRVREEGLLDLGTTSWVLLFILIISVAFNLSFLYDGYLSQVGN